VIGRSNNIDQSKGGYYLDDKRRAVFCKLDVEVEIDLRGSSFPKNTASLPKYHRELYDKMLL